MSIDKLNSVVGSQKEIMDIVRSMAVDFMMSIDILGDDELAECVANLCEKVCVRHGLKSMVVQPLGGRQNEYKVIYETFEGEEKSFNLSW